MKRHLGVLFVVCTTYILCCGQSVLTTEQANDKMRDIVRQLHECKALDSPFHMSKGWERMRFGPPGNVKSELKNSDNGTDFFAVVEFTIDGALGSKLYYPTEAEALADEPSHVGMIEKHIHVFRISSTGVVLQARTLRKRYPNIGNGDFGKTESDSSTSCWEQLVDSPDESVRH